MKLRVDHTTTYTFERAALYALEQVRKRPRDTEAQTVLNWELTLDGAKSEVQYSDQHGNRVDLISILPGATKVSITCKGQVETRDTLGVISAAGQVAPLWLYQRSTPLTQAGKGIRALVAKLGKAPERNLETLHTLMGLIADTVAYRTFSTGTTTTAEDSLALGEGVCQDHAHIFASAARLLGFPARYAGGYMMMTDRIEQGAGHAWAEVWVEGLGWTGFDASNRVSPDERYIRVATGLDYQEAGPVSGVTYGGESDSLSVSVQVQQQ